MRVLITGFGPFPGAPFNPSARLVKALLRRRRPALDGLEIGTHVFATSYAAVDRELPKLLAQQPDVVLLFGVAGRRRHLCIETRARNAVSLLFPDADRRKLPQGIIALGSPMSRKGDAPFMRLLAAARGRFPARLSRDAGTYLCNYVYWQALQRADEGRPLVQFVHIPPLRKTVRRSGKDASFAQLVRAAESVLIALIAASRRASRAG
ncbi:MAG TPA: pyroglutamyl-peptidase I [Xanthobacteraceae bacterium]|jgi:pyroglutamyl-peptidase|nr:pyroglutamyl-peptidase I [Xanthobacteraceae bacterium]